MYSRQIPYFITLYNPGMLRVRALEVQEFIYRFKRKTVEKKNLGNELKEKNTVERFSNFKPFRQ